MVGIWSVVGLFLTAVLVIELAVKPIIREYFSVDTEPDPEQPPTPHQADAGGGVADWDQCLHCGALNDPEYTYCHSCLNKLGNQQVSRFR